MRLPRARLTLSTMLFLPLVAHSFQYPTILHTLKNKLHTATQRLQHHLTPNLHPVSSSPLLTLHKSLVEIPSVTGDERAVAEWLATYLTSKNFTVETQSVGDFGEAWGTENCTSKRRENVYAYYGSRRDVHTLLTSHIDVVPPYIGYKETSNAIYGRGSCDAKASVAAQITAVEELRAAKDSILSPEGGDVGLLFVVGEEVTGDGMKLASEINPGWKTVIFGEPTELKLAVGHKGIAEFTVRAEGRAAHSGYPQLGINANSNLIKALYELDRVELPSSKLLGNSTVNIGQINGGVAANVIPAAARAVASVRVAGDLEETVRRINEAVGGVEGVTIEWFPTPHYGPVELDWDVEGFETIICSYGTDVPNLPGDHKRYLYGPGSILVAHGDNEHVLKSDLFTAVAGYKKLIQESLNPTRRAPALYVEKIVELEVETAAEGVEAQTEAGAAAEAVEPATHHPVVSIVQKEKVYVGDEL
ncbi:hypothetical protein DFH27DRAFT_178066 [Peziza echinospora]|nr:hypothetical protein DFH27DRAFT_178066 [Peziza echinospora]